MTEEMEKNEVTESPVTTDGDIDTSAPARTLWGDAWSRLRRNKLAIFGAVWIVLMILVALTADLWVPQTLGSPTEADSTTMTQDSRLPPSPEHPFGTDTLGRDVLCRVIYGARISLAVGVLATAISTIIGLVMGALAAYYGGIWDTIIMRLSEALMAVPRIMVSMALIAILGNSMMDLAVILSFSTIPMYIRMTRAMALGIKNTDYVKAAQIQGGGSMYIMFRHVLPNSISPIIILMMQNVGMTILMESGLSFLGIGITIPIPSWGTMVEAGRMYLIGCPVLAIAPGACVALLVISLNLLGDGIRDALDPRLRGEV